MQANSAMLINESCDSDAATQCAEIAGKFSEDFSTKLKVCSQIEETQDEERPQKEEEEVDVPCSNEEEKDQDNPDDDDDDEEEEFSFVCVNSDGSLISADDIFQDGQIRPIFPLLNRDLLLADGEDDDSKGEGPATLRPPLKKLFIEESLTSSSSSSSSSNSEPAEPKGPYCVWKGKAVEAAPSEVVCKKSNSTGFSKLWRFRELVLRSNSDGKDAFVFLNPQNQNNPSTTTTATTKTTSSSKKAEKSEKSRNEKKKVVKKGKSDETASSAHKKHYVMNRAKKEGGKRKSYLPYKNVGFFTDVNGLSRNVHPF